MAKYRKKPVVIEAEQFIVDQKPYPDGVYRVIYHGHEAYAINTLEGVLQVSDGDWIITGVQGERYPCKPAIFTATYDKVIE